MRLACVLAAVIAVVLALLTPATAKAALRVSDESPFTVQGVGFVPGERVTVVAQVKGRHVKTVTATKSGTFVVSFLTISLGNCPAYVVRATGNRGSRAYMRVMHECMPLGPPP